MTHESYARAPLKGTIEWSGGGLNLNGTTRVYGRTDPLYGEFQSLDIVGTGRPGTDTAGWEYRYHGYFEGRWPPFRGEVAIPLNQHLTIVGSVIRVKAHNGVSRPAGYVGSFIAVKQPGQPPGFPGLWNYRSFHNKKAAVYKTTALQRTQPQAHELLLQEAVFKLEPSALSPESAIFEAAFERELVELVEKVAATNAVGRGDMIRKTISCALAGLLTVVSALAFLFGLLGYWEPSSGVVVLSLIFGFTIGLIWFGSEVSEIFPSGRRRRAPLFIQPIINHSASEKKMPA